MNEKFTTIEWAAGANIYEVNVRQYTAEGSFAAFEKELPRLREMNVEILWFMPITPISTEKRLGTLGSYYSCSSYTTTNPEFGTPDDFRHLVEEAHKLGFKVIIDWVANHTGWDHVWTKEHPEYYKKNSKGEFYEANGWEDVIDLDFNNSNLRIDLIKAMKYWVVEAGIDGFRCDMAHLVPLSFWKEARTELDQIRKLFWLAETEEISYHEVFDATYAWQFLHRMEALWKKQINVNGLYDVLNAYKADFPESAIRLFFTSNHDENSHSGSEYERMGDAARAFAVLCATWHNSMPLVYSGQELPNTQRLKFFDKDLIPWAGHYMLHDFYKTLLGLHRDNPALHAGNNNSTIIRLAPDNEDVLAFLRYKDERQVIVILNLSSKNRVYCNISCAAIGGNYKNAFSGFEYHLTASETFEMQAWEYMIYEK